jgi:hypothetical protein
MSWWWREGDVSVDVVATWRNDGGGGTPSPADNGETECWRRGVREEVKKYRNKDSIITLNYNYYKYFLTFKTTLYHNTFSTKAVYSSVKILVS